MRLVEGQGEGVGWLGGLGAEGSGSGWERRAGLRAWGLGLGSHHTQALARTIVRELLARFMLNRAYAELFSVRARGGLV